MFDGALYAFFVRFSNTSSSWKSGGRLFLVGSISGGDMLFSLGGEEVGGVNVDFVFLLGRHGPISLVGVGLFLRLVGLLPFAGFDAHGEEVGGVFSCVVSLVLGVCFNN